MPPHRSGGKKLDVWGSFKQQRVGRPRRQESAGGDAEPMDSQRRLPRDERSCWSGNERSTNCKVHATKMLTAVFWLSLRVIRTGTRLLFGINLVRHTALTLNRVPSTTTRESDIHLLGQRPARPWLIKCVSGSVQYRSRVWGLTRENKSITMSSFLSADGATPESQSFVSLCREFVKRKGGVRCRTVLNNE